MIDLKDYGLIKDYYIDDDMNKDTVNSFQDGLCRNLENGMHKSDVDRESHQSILYGRVTQVHREMYKVITPNGECNAKLKGSLLNQVVSAEEFPAVGDFILLKYNEQGESQILKVCKRRSKFSRPDYSGHAAGYAKTILEQVVAANFDYVFILASLNYDFNINRILRYITVAWESGGIPVVILTKADLVEDYSEQLSRLKNQAIGVDVIAVSAVAGMGLDQLREYLIPGKTIVFLGSSGVGKSTLVNALAGEDIMKVNSIREDDSKGRHTTTHRQLIRLDSGVMIIDTPGMRELGMWDIKEGLGEAFSDIEDLFLQCKFSDCTHRSEPGCAVLAAIEEGTLEQKRWKNYLQIKNEAKYTQDKAAYLKDKKEFFKKINKDAKVRYKNGGKR
ncbi:ribosome small subunit-dependent GTPase A [Mobilitalea sibirica]|uniref:Small ribosomal subunit biogenesis GTPase RsgA n=1 Tax=Mobilitalea sibirica TaxID=1462919 RepID=A0A8J7GY33_9FIRM|nr:ribosome small subunit-dependent GTPase A [Mobilitalea sibirica]MBH1940284.1 ribosome small subunit-dependent GTPase A [Mobilitalea sibirica]